MRKVLKNDLAKHGLNKTWIKDKKLVSFGGRPNRGEEEKERRREEEEEEEGEEEEGRRGSQIKVWKLNLSMELYGSMEF